MDNEKALVRYRIYKFLVAAVMVVGFFVISFGVLVAIKPMPQDMEWWQWLLYIISFIYILGMAQFGFFYVMSRPFEKINTKIKWLEAQIESDKMESIYRKCGLLKDGS